MDYFPTPAMEGEQPFKCYVCHKLLITHVEGEYTIKMQCPRCKTKITLESKKSLPDALVVKHGELVHL